MLLLHAEISNFVVFLVCVLNFVSVFVAVVGSGFSLFLDTLIFLFAHVFRVFTLLFLLFVILFSPWFFILDLIFK